ncbi:EamA family transporter [Pseudoflavitalea sp. X16]|uniref:DMT family transporter n=1 Tax=Paraflavitalea devenefica TaxID=2716334 RepID=UPI001423EDA2|nr:EamA family transporter [Paraflavitalea devenefica]NII24901.1 EamA family transporter [Paraflavitalea devenefica]
MAAPTYIKPFLQQRGTRFKALFALGMVCFFWGTTWIASRQGVKYMPALQLAGIRQSIGGLLYVIFFLSKGIAWPRGKEWGPIIVLSLLNFALSNGLSTWGVKYISAGLGAIIAATFPLWIVIINLFVAKSKIPVKAVIGLLLGFAGVCVIFYEHLADFLEAEFRFGILLSLAASWTWAFGTLYTKQQAAAFNPYFSLGLQMLISGILTTIITYAFGEPIPISDIPWQSWTAIAYLATFGSVISFIAYLYALQNLPTEQASIYAYINPVVAVLLGSLLFNEKLTLFIAAGGTITLLGVHLINQAFRKKIANPSKHPNTPSRA